MPDLPGLFEFPRYVTLGIKNALSGYYLVFDLYAIKPQEVTLGNADYQRSIFMAPTVLHTGLPMILSDPIVTPTTTTLTNEIEFPQLPDFLEYKLILFIVSGVIDGYVKGYLYRYDPETGSEYFRAVFGYSDQYTLGNNIQCQGKFVDIPLDKYRHGVKLVLENYNIQGSAKSYVSVCIRCLTKVKGNVVSLRGSTFEDNLLLIDFTGVQSLAGNSSTKHSFSFNAFTIPNKMPDVVLLELSYYASKYIDFNVYLLNPSTGSYELAGQFKGGYAQVEGRQTMLTIDATDYVASDGSVDGYVEVVNNDSVERNYAIISLLAKIIYMF